MATDPLPDDPGPVLTADSARGLFAGCLAEAGCDGLAVEGIVTGATFDRARIAGRCDDIRALLAELPGQFRSSGGGGWSFLNACEDRHDRQWTGMHRDMEQLFMLGIAAGLVALLMPRDLWEALPGGMPYYLVEI